MDDMMPHSADVRAPNDAVAWSPARGFVFDRTERETLLDYGYMVLDVNDDGDVNDVEDTSLAALIRIEREIVDLYELLRDIADHAHERLAKR